MKKVLLSTLMLSSAIVSPALAQDASNSTDSGSDSGEIIVTAQRRAENLQSVPVSVTPVTSADLRARNLNNLQQITLAAPSLQVGQENTYSIRGVGTLAFQQTVDPAVAISMDEVNLARAALSEGIFNDVAQVEVLNGPQGLLFGKNATAGLLNITTTKPKLNVFSGEAELEYNLRDTTPGNGQGVIARTSANIPVGDISALRVSLAYEYQNPVVRAAQTGPGSDIDRRSFDSRVKYLIEPTDNLSIYVIGNYAKLRGTAGLFDRTYRSLGANSTNAAALAADGYTASPDLLEYKADGSNYRTLENYGAQVRVSYVLPNEWELINLAAYKGYDLDYSFDQDFTTGNSASLSASSTRFNQYSNELRLALPANNALSGQVGLFFMSFNENTASRTEGDLYLPSFLLPAFPFCVGAVVDPACSVNNDFAIGSDNAYRFKSTSYAAFGQLTYDFGNGLKVLAGGRFTHDKISIDTVQNLQDYFVRFGGPRGSFADGTKNSDFSWKIGAQYQATDDILLYGTYAKGYKGPGANNTAATATARLAVDPETSRSLEIGAKTSWFDHKLIFNAALFRSKYSNYQASAFDAQAASLVIRNAASLTSKGAELSLTAKPVKRLTLNATASILDSKFDDFPGAQCYVGQGCSTFNAAGQRTPMAAKFTSSAFASYELPITSDISLLINGDWYHRSSVNYTLGNNPATALGAVDLFGARATLDLGGNLRVSVFCKNCGDKRTPNFIYSDPGDASQGINSAVQTFGLNSVRTIGASFGYKF